MTVCGPRARGWRSCLFGEIASKGDGDGQMELSLMTSDVPTWMKALGSSEVSRGRAGPWPLRWQTESELTRLNALLGYMSDRLLSLNSPDLIPISVT